MTQAVKHKSNSEILNEVNSPLKMDFSEFYKELEAHFLGAGTKLIGLQLLQLDLRLGKTPSRSFRPVKSGFAIGERHLPIESIIASRSTDVMVEPQ
ncbi:hypothetical protein Tco_0438759 [Tanacetum coccineum]